MIWQKESGIFFVNNSKIAGQSCHTNVFTTTISMTGKEYVRGFGKGFFKSEITMEVGGWVQVSLRIFFGGGKSSKNSPKPVLIFWSSLCVCVVYLSMCSLSVYILLKVVGYYDLSVLSMLVMGFQKKIWMDGGWVG